MYAFWACKDIGNFGDMVTPYILEKLGQKVEFSWMRGIAMDGSILGAVKPDMHVYGAGFMNITDSCKSSNIKYVRGEISKAMLKVQGIDVSNIKTHIPAFCIAEFIQDKKPTKDREFAFHYIDYSDFGIDVRKPVETVVNDILDCKNIITSSLHAYIVARMYGRGAALVKTKQTIAGDGMKYVDAFSCWGEKSYIPMDIKNDTGIENELKKTYGNPIKFSNKEYLKDLNDYICQL
jgi:pyruvyltransferase